MYDIDMAVEVRLFALKFGGTSIAANFSCFQALIGVFMGAKFRPSEVLTAAKFALIVGINC